MKIKNIISIMAILSLFGCGNKSTSSDGNNAENENSRAPVEATPGTYYAVLRPMNFHSNGFIPYGAATFKLINNELQVSVVMDDDQAVSHRQSLHIGTRCPTLADDTNGDGFIDYEEAQRVVGQIIMPLDSDLNTQVAGQNVLSRGPAMTYYKVASVSAVNTDLWSPDEDPSDNVMKLSPGKGIGFEQRVVLVHGTSSQSSFPQSLASFRGEPVHLSLPIVCGVLRKIE